MRIRAQDELDYITSRPTTLAAILAKLEYDSNDMGKAAQGHTGITLDTLAYRTAIGRKLLQKKALLKTVEIDARRRVRDKANKRSEKITVAEIKDTAELDPQVIDLRREVDNLELLDDYAKLLVRHVDRRIDQMKLSTDSNKTEGYVLGQTSTLGRLEAEADLKSVRRNLKHKYPGGF